MEKGFPTLVSQHIEIDQGQKGGSTAIDMDAHIGCRNRVYEDNVLNPKLAAGGRSQCKFERAARKLFGPFERAARKPFVPLRRRLSPPEKGKILLSNVYYGATEGSEVSQANR